MSSIRRLEESELSFETRRCLQQLRDALRAEAALNEPPFWAAQVTFDDLRSGADAPTIDVRVV